IVSGRHSGSRGPCGGGVEHLVHRRCVVVEEYGDLTHAEDHPSEAAATGAPGRLEAIWQLVGPARLANGVRGGVEHRGDLVHRVEQPRQRAAVGRNLAGLGSARGGAHSPNPLRKLLPTTPESSRLGRANELYIFGSFRPLMAGTLPS